MIHNVSPTRVDVTGGMYSDSNWHWVWRGNVTTVGQPGSPGGHQTIGTFILIIPFVISIYYLSMMFNIKELLLLSLENAFI
jgi:hypothetical protein